MDRTAVVSGLLAALLIPACASPQVDGPTDERGVASIAPMLEKVTPAVVNISVVSERPIETNPLYRDPFFRRFFDLPELPRARPQMSAGSGVIVDADNGYVLTNNHVVARGNYIVVTLKDRRRFDAELVGSDSETDIALLKIDPLELTEAMLGDSGRVQVGDFVAAVGNPFGLGQTVTSGIVGALGRSGLNIEGYEDFIQTDAPINPGNSGGALLTLDGRLIGINTAIIAPAGGNVGIGFAIPINMARAVMDQLVEYGEVRRGRLGVLARDLTPEMAEALSLPSRVGAIIARVERDSPAERADMRPGDVVTAVNGRPIYDAGDLRNAIGLVPAGSGVDLTILRNGHEMIVFTYLVPGQLTPADQQSAVERLFAGTEFAAAKAWYGRLPTGRLAHRGWCRRWQRGCAGWAQAGRPCHSCEARAMTSVEAMHEAVMEARPALAHGLWRNGTKLSVVAR